MSPKTTPMTRRNQATCPEEPPPPPPTLPTHRFRLPQPSWKPIATKRGGPLLVFVAGEEEGEKKRRNNTFHCTAVGSSSSNSHNSNNHDSNSACINRDSCNLGRSCTLHQPPSLSPQAPPVSALMWGGDKQQRGREYRAQPITGSQCQCRGTVRGCVSRYICNQRETTVGTRRRGRVQRQNSPSGDSLASRQTGPAPATLLGGVGAARATHPRPIVSDPRCATLQLLNRTAGADAGEWLAGKRCLPERQQHVPAPLLWKK